MADGLPTVPELTEGDARSTGLCPLSMEVSRQSSGAVERKEVTKGSSKSPRLRPASAKQRQKRAAKATVETGAAAAAGSGSAVKAGPPRERTPFPRQADPSLTGGVDASWKATDDRRSRPYYEIQVDGWCGKHALNNFLEGPYVTEDDCRRACSQVVKALSEAGGGRVEDSAQHMHPGTGWLSIDVINVLGQGLLGYHVQGSSTAFDEFVALGAADALVNWNNQHWTVLRSRSCDGPWTHINSVYEGSESFHGRVETADLKDVSEILADIQRHCGGVTLHRIAKAAGDGRHLLEPAGLRAMLPKEDELCQPCEPETSEELSEISVVTVNVDGLGDYPIPPVQRIVAILDEVLLRSPDVLLLQEVTMPMYAEIQRRLVNWKVYKKQAQAEEYFDVTCTNWRWGGAGRSSSYSFPSSNNGRHTLTVRTGDWAVINVHLESGPRSVDRDARAEQLLYLSRVHDRDAAKVHVVAGDLNLRPGEDQCLLAEGWQDVFKDAGQDDWTWRQSSSRARYDRIYIRSCTSATVGCVQTQRLHNVWGNFTDHVALQAVLRKVSQGPRRRARAQSAGGQVPAVTASADAGAAAGQSSSSSFSIPATASSGTGKQRQDVDLVRIANAVDAASASFHQLIQLCEEDPCERDDLEEESLPNWTDIPMFCGFRILRPLDNGVRRSATPADKLAQRQQYAKCRTWIQQCDLSESEFRAMLEDVPTDRNQRGRAELPQCLQLPKCTAWQHAMRRCIDVAIRKAAAVAGKKLGLDTRSWKPF